MIGKKSGFRIKSVKTLPRIWVGKKKITDTEKFVTGNYLEVGKGLPYRKICFQNYIGNNFGQDGILGYFGFSSVFGSIQKCKITDILFTDRRWFWEFLTT